MSGVGTTALVYVVLSSGWRQIPAPRKGRKKGEWETGVRPLHQIKQYQTVDYIVQCSSNLG